MDSKIKTAIYNFLLQNTSISNDILLDCSLNGMLKREFTSNIEGYDNNLLHYEKSALEKTKL